MDAAVVGPPRGDVTEVEVDGLACLFSPTTGDVLVLNQSASDVWYLCDGTETLAGVTTRLAGVYGVSPESIAADVESAVASFREAGLLGTDPQPGG